MKKVIVGLVLVLLMVGCTQYASQEQMDELQARREAVASLKQEIKEAQKEEANMKEEKMELQEEIEKLEKELAECKKKIQ